MARMEEYYKILHFLDIHDVDRIYPCEDYFLDDEGNNITFTGDSFLFKPNRESFSQVDYVEVLLESTESFNTSDLKFNFSEFPQGYAPLLILECDESVDVPINEPYKVVFKLKKSPTMTDPARNLTGIKSVELITSNNQSFKLYDIIFRNDNASFNLEELDRFIDDGKYYILSRLHMGYDELPEDLADHVYTAAAGYAWSSKWEFEARVMNDEQKNAKSYGKWLFAIVDTAIDDWKEANDISDEDELLVVDDIVTSRPLIW